MQVSNSSFWGSNGGELEEGWGVVTVKGGGGRGWGEAELGLLRLFS